MNKKITKKEIDDIIKTINKEIKRRVPENDEHVKYFKEDNLNMCMNKSFINSIINTINSLKDYNHKIPNTYALDDNIKIEKCIECSTHLDDSWNNNPPNFKCLDLSIFDSILNNLGLLSKQLSCVEGIGKRSIYSKEVCKCNIDKCNCNNDGCNDTITCSANIEEYPCNHNDVCKCVTHFPRNSQSELCSCNSQGNICNCNITKPEATLINKIPCTCNSVCDYNERCGCDCQSFCTCNVTTKCTCDNQCTCNSVCKEFFKKYE